MKYITIPVDGGKAHIFIEAGMIVWELKQVSIELSGFECIETPLSAEHVLSLIALECLDA